MADYREISQEYAQGGFKAVALLNGGSAVALLTQLDALKELAQPVLVSTSWWAVGVSLSALAWVAGFLSTRYVDKSDREGSSDHLATSNKWMAAALLFVMFSLVCFMAGALCMAMGFHAAYSQ